MPNADRLHAILDHIKTLPNVRLGGTNDPTVPAWDQRKWMALPANTMIEGSCGTTGCFAGWAVMMYVPDFQLDLRSETMYGHDMVYNVIVDGTSITIEELARQLLDLNGFEADALFDYDNSIEDLEAVITKIIEGRLDPEYDDEDDL